MRKIFVAFFLSICCLTTALASEKVSGTFEAVRGCEAYSSFRKGHNPGLVRVQPGAFYQAIEINKKGDWDWIRIRINAPASDAPLRWVARECGKTNIEAGDDEKPRDGGHCSTPNLYDSFVLALSWQPGFCEHYPFSGVKPECNALENGSIVLNHLTIHGLWPNRQECGTNYGNCADTPLDLAEDTIIRLAPWMPNFYFSTVFGEYEWKKHGTCQGLEDDAYFLLAKGLAQQVDSSEIGAYLRAHIGSNIRPAEFKAEITASMGEDMARHVQLVCTRGKYLEEIRLNLPKQIDVDASLPEMVARAKPTATFTKDCGSEIYIERSGRD